MGYTIKVQPNPFASPGPGYHPRHYRDPFVYRDEHSGTFHMLVTASLEQHALDGRGGCLVQLTSPDLSSWSVDGPFLIPGIPPSPSAPTPFSGTAGTT